MVLRLLIRTICVLALCLAQMAAAFELTDEERAFIAERPTIVVGGETDWPPMDYVEDGVYKGAAKDVPNVEVFMSGQRGLTRAQKKWLRRRQAVEPVIGHMKSDHRMARNYLQGWEGDRINATLAAAAFNFAKLFRAVALFVRFWVLKILLREPDGRTEQRFERDSALRRVVTILRLSGAAI